MLFTFGDCSIDCDLREIRRGDALVAVEPQVFDVLVYLIRHRDRVVSRDDLLEGVWGGRIVSESTLSSRVNSARSAIGDSGDKQQWIRTVARKGFRFVGEVREQPAPGEASAAGPRLAERKASPTASAGPASPPPPDKPSIAVLPFTNMSGDPEQEYFSDGITEDIVTALSRLRWFFVIARNSTFAYKGQRLDVRQIGRDLGVRYLLEGSVRKSGQRLRITSQLLDATTGSHIWSERYDRELTEIFALQDEITASVTAAIEPKLLAAEAIRSQRRSSDHVDAWDLVMRALTHYWRITTTDSRIAIELLRQAVERYPNYGPAHSMLAFALLVSNHLGYIPEKGHDLAYAAGLAHRAAQLDDDDPWAHVALGYLAFTARQTDDAVREYRRALDLNPNFATAYGYLGWALVFDGQGDEAVQNFQQALRMSPHDPLRAFFCSGTSVAHYYGGRYDEAVSWARTAIQLRPEFTAAHRILCASLAMAGREQETRAAMGRLRELQPNVSIEWIKQYVPYTARAMPHFLEGMRKAGLE
jgi:TolB-like protein/cytochrome c-type biogenesis protein CcmH/NrfG